MKIIVNKLVKDLRVMFICLLNNFLIKKKINEINLLPKK